MNDSLPVVRVALVGMGRMGKAIDALASDRHCEIVARVGRAESERGLSAAVLNGAQVAIEFSHPETAVANAVACLRAHCPVVIGTTGWSESIGKLAEAVAHNQCSALW
ncbi:MAG: hypothetical protein M3Y64_10205, partial [Gemmatimonadota bacterium]|nr:hypothetical protein [Gemmatimonadota bacterium]